MKLKSQVARAPVYLWLVSLIPILHLYNANFGLVRDNEVAQTAIGMLAATTLGYLLAKPLTPNPHKRAFYLSLASLAFSTSGHLYSLFVMPQSLFIWTIASACAATAIAIACARFIPQQNYAHLTTPFNLIATALLALQIISLLAASLAAQRFADANSPGNQTWQEQASSEKALDSPQRPDIYYIIPDGYPSDARLLYEIDYDNSQFTNALQERGFVIAPHAQSNYAYTVLSLPSILNMQFFNENPTQFSDRDYLQLSTANNAVARRLKQLGYTYVQLLSGYLYISPNADIVLDYTPAGPIDIAVANGSLPTQDLVEHDLTKGAAPKNLHIRQPFAQLFLDSTALRIVRSQLEKLSPQASSTPYKRKTAERFLATIDSINAIVKMPEATFTIMHLLEPYSNVTFNANGDIIPNNTKPSRDQYIAELPFVNSQFLRLIDTIINGSQHQPIIIFQADHGSGASLKRFGNGEDGGVAYDAYASYYLPDAQTLDLPSPFTLVNSFPLLLNHLFGLDLALQDDRLIHVDDRHAPFEQQVDVTEAFLHK